MDPYALLQPVLEAIDAGEETRVLEIGADRKVSVEREGARGLLEVSRLRHEAVVQCRLCGCRGRQQESSQGVKQATLVGGHLHPHQCLRSARVRQRRWFLIFGQAMVADAVASWCRVVPPLNLDGAA